MSGVTTCLRFPGQLNADLRKLAVNMVSCHHRISSPARKQVVVTNFTISTIVLEISFEIGQRNFSTVKNRN